MEWIELITAMDGASIAVLIALVVIVLSTVAVPAIGKAVESRSKWRGLAEEKEATSIRALVQTSEMYRDTASHLEERMKAVEDNYDNACERIDSMQETIKSLEGRLANRENRIKKLEAEIASLRLELDNRNDRIMELEEQVKLLMEERESLQAELKKTVGNGDNDL